MEQGRQWMQKERKRSSPMRCKLVEQQLVLPEDCYSTSLRSSDSCSTALAAPVLFRAR